MRSPAVLTILALVLCASLAAEARSPVRMWIDKAGTLHVDDTPEGPRSPPSSRVKGRKAEGQAAKKTQPARWWERATDAPPDEIDKAARLYNIPAELVRAVIAAESGGQAEAISHKGAIGLMQLMPGTAKKMYVEDPVDPAQNILGGTRYLRTLANQFNGDMMLVVAAYNAGPDAVRKYGGVPPFDETRGYVKKVMGYYKDLKRESAKAAAPQVASSTDPRPGERP